MYFYLDKKEAYGAGEQETKVKNFLKAEELSEKDVEKLEKLLERGKSCFGIFYLQCLCQAALMSTKMALIKYIKRTVMENVL